MVGDTDIKDDSVPVVEAEIKIELVVDDNKQQEVINKPIEYTHTPILGRLKRTLSEKCPDCHKPLQLRARKEIIMIRGEESSIEKDYKCCSAICGYEEEIEQRKRKVKYDKTALKLEKDVPEKNEIRRDRNNNGHSNRSRPNNNSGRISKTSYASNKRRTNRDI